MTTHTSVPSQSWPVVAGLPCRELADGSWDYHWEEHWTPEEFHDWLVHKVAVLLPHLAEANPRGSWRDAGMSREAMLEWYAREPIPSSGRES